MSKDKLNADESAETKESDFIAHYIEKQFIFTPQKPLDKKEEHLQMLLNKEPEKKQYFA